MFTYQQTTGILRQDEKTVGAGYSGHGVGLNNPALQDQHDIGPIPQGWYDMVTIVDAENVPTDYEGKKSPVLRIIPRPETETYGRGGFLCHGDLIGEVGQHQASHGCIIQQHDVRVLISQSEDKSLEVIE